jgi:hypothetical protein
MHAGYLMRKKPAAAIEKCDRVISSFKARCGSSKEAVYYARSSAESFRYPLKSAADKRGKSEIAFSTWAVAYFMIAYASWISK